MRSFVEFIWGNWFLLVFGLVIIIVLLIFAFLILRKVFKSKKKKAMIGKSIDSVLFEVRVPSSNEVEIHAADQMMTSFLGIQQKLKGLKKLTGASYYISFELVAFPDSIRFYVNVPKEIALLVEKQIHGAYPESDVSIAKEYNLFNPKQVIEYCSLELDEKNYIPIMTYEELSNDGLSSITSVMSKLDPGESMACQFVISPAGNDWRKEGKKYVKKVRDTNADPEKSNIEADEDTLVSIEKKAEKGGFFVDIRLVSCSINKESARINLQNLVHTFDQYSRQGGNKFKKKSPQKVSDKREFIQDFIYRFPKQSIILNTSELASLFHFPNAGVQTPHINWLRSKRAPASSNIPSRMEQGSVYLGVNEYRGVKRPIYLAKKDRRRHFYYVGKTGAGKSVFIQSMILQDIKNGEGLAFLDPHGDSVEWIVDRIPPERAEDVIYFNPADYERPIGMNIMEWYTEMDKHIITNGMLGLMQKLFDPQNQGFTGPRFEQAVRNAMLTVMAKKGTSLIEVMQLLQNDKYAEEYLPYLDDEIIKRFWKEQIAKTQEFHKSEILGYVTSKFDRFITNKLIRNMI